MKYFSPLALVIFIFLTLSACTAAQQSDLMENPQTSPPAKGEKIAVIKTTKGTIHMKFFPVEAPETVKNFQELATKGFFNGITFHRVIPNFMIQGGDPTGTGTGGETYKGPNTSLPGEISTKLHHLRGTAAMANKGGNPATATSQFFIVQNKSGVPHLDGGYTIFGQVFEGFDVVDAIAHVERDAADKPLKPITMEKVTIEER